MIDAGVERDRDAAVLGERELLVGGRAHLDVVGLEPDRRAVDLEIEPAVGLERVDGPSRRRPRASSSLTFGMSLPTFGPSRRKFGTTE